MKCPRFIEFLAFVSVLFYNFTYPFKPYVLTFSNSSYHPHIVLPWAVLGIKHNLLYKTWANRSGVFTDTVF